MGVEGGNGRLLHSWQEYFPAASASEEISFVDEIADTLDRCRSSLPWKAIVTIYSTSKLSQITDLISRPVRSDGGHNIAFAFRSQGAVYKGIGIVLLDNTVFRKKVESFNGELILGYDCSVLVQGPKQTYLLTRILLREKALTS